MGKQGSRALPWVPAPPRPAGGPALELGGRTRWHTSFPTLGPEASHREASAPHGIHLDRGNNISTGVVVGIQ